MSTTPALSLSTTDAVVATNSRSSQNFVATAKESVERISFAETSFVRAPTSESVAGSFYQTDGLNFFETIANFVVFLLRSAILFLPTMMRDVGLIPAVVLMVIANFTVCECSILTMRCCEIAESIPGRLISDPDRTGFVQTFEALAGESLGAIGNGALSVTKNFYFLGLVIVYSLLVTDGIHLFLKDFGVDVQIVRWCITAPLFCFLGMIKDLKQVKRFAAIGVGAGFLQCALIMAGAGYEQFGPDFTWPEHDLARGGVLDMGAALSTSLFGFQSLVVTVPAVRTQMARKEVLPAAIRVSMVIVLVIYLSAICLCYLVFGRTIRGNILDNIIIDCWRDQCIVGAFTEIILMVNLLIGVPSFVFFVMTALESAGNWRICKTLSCANIVFRIIMMLTLVSIGMALPHVKELVGLISASFGACNCLVFPPLFYFGIKKRRLAADPTYKVQKSCLGFFRHVFIFLITVYAMPFGVTGAVQNLVAAMTSA